MIGESPRSTPGTVVTLGSLWLVAAGVLLAWSISLIFLMGVIRNFTPGGTDPLPPAPPVAQPLSWAFEHYVLTGSILGALALLGLYSGIQFLRLRQWARTFLEAGGWTAIVLSLILGIWRSQFWVAPGPQDAAGFDNAVLDGTVKLIAGLLVAAYFAVFPVVFVWLLRSSWVRPAFSSDGRSPSRAA